MSKISRTIGALVFATTLALGMGAASAEPQTASETAQSSSTSQRVEKFHVQSFGGTIISIADNPHPSYSEVSVHGCWKLGVNGQQLAGKKATVQVWLQVKIDGRWVTLDHNKDDVYPGCGRGKRVTARAECHGSQTNQFRNMVDVDVNWVIDSPGRSYAYATLPCTV